MYINVRAYERQREYKVSLLLLICFLEILRRKKLQQNENKDSIIFIR